MPYKHTFFIRVRYSEVDSQGIVFNGNYLNYFDIAVTEYFRSLGLSYTEFIHKHNIDFHVVRSSIEYKKPLRFDDEFQISIDGTCEKFKIFWNISIVKSETLHTKGLLEYICMNTTLGKPVRLPYELRNLLKFNNQ